MPPRGNTLALDQQDLPEIDVAAAPVTGVGNFRAKINKTDITTTKTHGTRKPDAWVWPGDFPPFTASSDAAPASVRCDVSTVETDQRSYQKQCMYFLTRMYSVDRMLVFQVRPALNADLPRPLPSLLALRLARLPAYSIDTTTQSDVLLR